MLCSFCFSFVWALLRFLPLTVFFVVCLVLFRRSVGFLCVRVAFVLIFFQLFLCFWFVWAHPDRLLEKLEFLLAVEARSPGPSPGPKKMCLRN